MVLVLPQDPDPGLHYKLLRVNVRQRPELDGKQTNKFLKDVNGDMLQPDQDAQQLCGHDEAPNRLNFKLKSGSLDAPRSEPRETVS